MNYIQARFYFSFFTGKAIKRLPDWECLSKTKIKIAIWMLKVCADTLEWKIKKELGSFKG